MFSQFSRSQKITLGMLVVVCVALSSILCATVILRPAQGVDQNESKTHTAITHTNGNSSGQISSSQSNASTTQGDTLTNTTTQTPVFTTQEFVLMFSDGTTDGSVLPQQYTCDGAGTFPQIAITNIPKKTVSLAFVLHDPDMPVDVRADRTWYHFLSWNMPPTAEEIRTDFSEPVRYGTTTSASTTYIPPCPPDGEHRYIFTLYALDAVLDLGSGATADQFFTAITGHVLKKAQLTTTYNRHDQTTSAN